MSSDINELYRRVIYQNNTLFDLLKTSRSTPGELVTCQEKLVQEAADTLLDNGIREQPMRDGHNNVYNIVGYILLSGAPNENKGTGGDTAVGFDSNPINVWESLKMATDMEVDFGDLEGMWAAGIFRVREDSFGCTALDKPLYNFSWGHVSSDIGCGRRILKMRCMSQKAKVVERSEEHEKTSEGGADSDGVEGDFFHS
ncbi:DNA-directed RNA polymerase subunit beta' [Acorus calamus]|uniref:DNA-directed RNA polymerase subunit beta n=1 Tax=Acorus calamus TaxID=4465 RepID=A0AAV9CZ87_ACOCL|nr:DNA-directed RNA polymerase subunit beta' [Acorus calamus]